MATKSQKRSAYRCTECGWQTVKWVGRCGECQAWGTVEEVGAVAVRTQAATKVATPARPISDVDATAAARTSTGVGEFDRVLGGGLVPGAVMLVAGEPGIGKSTLLLDVAARTARRGPQVLYVTGEESAAQVRLRADRTSALADSLYLASETDLATVLAHIDAVKPSLLIIDSVQTIASAEIEGSAGNVSQVREVAAAIIHVAKARNISTLLVGHVTKEGSIAGPRLLEHLVDVVITFEGERHSRLRLVRAVKNRYGPTDEVGCFDLADGGIVGLSDPSSLFLTSRDKPVAGTCVTVTLEGRRPLVTEVQALVAPSAGGSPRRTTSGVDGARTAMILAVLERRAGAPVSRADCYVSSVGGARLSEPACDLALALALLSSAQEKPLPAGLIAVGEVGLSGDIRAVGGVPRRLAEAARIGFDKAIIPAGALGDEKPPPGMRIAECADLGSAMRALDSAAVSSPSANPPARNSSAGRSAAAASSRGASSGGSEAENTSPVETAKA